MTQSTSLLIIEDEEVILQKFHNYSKELFDQIYLAPNIKTAQGILDQNPIDCILTDNQLPDGFGIDLIIQQRELGNQIPIIIITAYAETHLAIDSVNYGVSFFLEKPVHRDQIIETLNKCLKGHIQKIKQDELSQKFEILPKTREYLAEENHISKREFEVIQLILEHQSNKNVAKELFISSGTVKNHLANIFDKMGVNSKEELKEHIYQLNLKMGKK